MVVALTHYALWPKVWEVALGIHVILSEAFLGLNVRVLPCPSKENRSQKKRRICVLPLSRPIVVQGSESGFLTALPSVAPLSPLCPP